MRLALVVSCLVAVGVGRASAAGLLFEWRLGYAPSLSLAQDAADRSREGWVLSLVDEADRLVVVDENGVLGA
jgi:hypothetical protein